MTNKITPVVVAVDDRYNDNNGAYQIAYLWDGETVYTEGGIYCDKVYTVNCSVEQKEAAINWKIENTELSIPYNKYCYGGRGARTYIGCTIKLAKSRKAPNKVELKVTAFHESYYDGYYNQHVGEKITVTDGNNSWVVSSNCIAEVVKGVKDIVYWAQK